MNATPTIAGSRSGGLIAQCWASMMALGYKGYVKNASNSFYQRVGCTGEATPGIKL